MYSEILAWYSLPVCQSQIVLSKEEAAEQTSTATEQVIPKLLES